MRTLIGFFLCTCLVIVLGCTQPKPTFPAKAPSVNTGGEVKPAVVGGGHKGGGDEEAAPPAKKDTAPPPPPKKDNSPPAENKEPTKK